MVGKAAISVECLVVSVILRSKIPLDWTRGYPFFVAAPTLACNSYSRKPTFGNMLAVSQIQRIKCFGGVSLDERADV